MNQDVSNYTEWIDKPAEITTNLSVETANLMQATLDRKPTFSAGDQLPPAWHWLYFHEAVAGSDLGREGHPKLGDFMPPVPLPRRMWAGGTLTFHQPVLLGREATKRSVVQSVTPKTGRSGELYFVNVGHELWQEGTLCLEEAQTIVYREPPQPDAPQVEPKEAPTDAQVMREVTPDPIMLFRYSALTFNGHRIHYDADFCREVEGYPDLVVHGPLIATLLLDLFVHALPQFPISTFSYKARSPLFNPAPFTVNGKIENDVGSAWATNATGGLAMWADLK